MSFISEALKSALDQDYENLEVVVSDDASNDGTAEVIMEYAQRYPRRLVPIIGGPNLGITGNCNRALEMCRGKYIAFLAGDDVLLPGKIRKQVAWFEEDDRRVLCGHQVEVFYEGNNRKHTYKPFLTKGIGPKKWIEYGSQYGSTSIMVRSSCIPPEGFSQKLPMVSDLLFWIDCLGKGGQYGFIRGTYAKYRKHTNNFTNNKIAAIQELEKMFEIIEEKYPMYQKECKRGRTNLVDYGLGLFYLNNFETKKALKLFWKSLMRNPYNYKTMIRVAQTFSHVFLKRKPKFT